MRKVIPIDPAQNRRMFTAAIADIQSRIEQYSFTPRYYLTIEYGVLHKSPTDLTGDHHQIDRVVERFIHRGKKHTDTPGRIYFVEHNADRGYHTHIIMEQLPLKTINYYADKIFLQSPESEQDLAEREDRVIEQLGAHLRENVDRMSKSKEAFKNVTTYCIEGLTRYNNKSFFDPRIIGADHIDYMNGSIFDPRWINNRLNTLIGAM